MKDFDLIVPAILDVCTKDELLAHIKSVAIRASHMEVHRQEFQVIKQEEGQPITNYQAKLKSQAKLCDFDIQSVILHTWCLIS